MQLIFLTIFMPLMSVQCLIIKSNEHSAKIELNKDINFHYEPNVLPNSTTTPRSRLNLKSKYEDYQTTEEKIELINNKIQSIQKRAAPREKNQECVVSTRELNDLKSVVDSAMTNLTATSTNCDINKNAKNKCTELLKLIQCGISNIINEYNAMTTDSSNHIVEYQKIYNAYEMLNNKYLKVKDEVKALNENKYKSNIDKLTTDMQNIEKQLRESNDINLKKSIELCALQIHTGKIENSINEYNNIMKFNKLISIPKIIDKVYTHITNENKNNNIENSLKFIEKIPEKCEQFSLYLSLISKMQDENHFACYLSHYWSKLKNLSYKMNGQDLGKITDCSTQYMESFETQLHKIINHICKNCYPNVENAIKFIDELLSTKQKIVAYPVLFEEMKKRNGLNGYEIVLLAFRIQEILMTRKTENLSGITKIKDELPSGVNVLITSGAVRLKTKVLNNSNFALLYGKQTYACTDTVDQYQDWIIRVHQRGRYFQFINVGNAHSMRSHDNKMTLMLTTGFCDRHLWEIIPILNGASFIIKNKYYGNVIGVDVSSKSQSNLNCYQARGYHQFTGDEYQQWEFKHKL